MKFIDGVPIPTHEYDDLIDSITIKSLDIVESTTWRYFIRIGKLKIYLKRRKYLILRLPNKNQIWDDANLCFYAIDLNCTEPSQYEYWHDHPDIREVKKIDKSKLSKKQAKNLENLLAYLPTDEYTKDLFYEKQL